MKSLASSATQPSSQLVFRAAPVMTNTWPTLRSSVCSVWLFRHRTDSRWSLPSSATISVCGLSIILGVSSILVISTTKKPEVKIRAQIRIYLHLMETTSWIVDLTNRTKMDSGTLVQYMV
jgi:hypothetical protein